jgi:hypothetical protein
MVNMNVGDEAAADQSDRDPHGDHVSNASSASKVEAWTRNQGVVA